MTNTPNDDSPESIAAMRAEMRMLRRWQLAQDRRIAELDAQIARQVAEINQIYGDLLNKADITHPH